MLRLRRQVLTGGHLPVPGPGDRVRLLFRRVFLRRRFVPFAVPLIVMYTVRRSPGNKAGRMRSCGRGGKDAG